MGGNYNEHRIDNLRDLDHIPAFDGTGNQCASGIVSVIKSIFMLYYGFILPSADFEKVNDVIPLADWNMRVATRQRSWPSKKKYVCVNNFGFSGSNST